MPKKNKTNLERLSGFIGRHGAKSLLIHTVPGTGLWLVAQKKKSGIEWKIDICYPNQTKTRLISDHVSDYDHITLWKELIGQAVSNKLKQAQAEYKKSAKNFYQNNKNKKHAKKLRSNHPSR